MFSSASRVARLWPLRPKPHTITCLLVDMVRLAILVSCSDCIIHSLLENFITILSDWR
jgi:hypothetical protein